MSVPALAGQRPQPPRPTEDGSFDVADWHLQQPTESRSGMRAWRMNGQSFLSHNTDTRPVRPLGRASLSNSLVAKVR